MKNIYYLIVLLIFITPSYFIYAKKNCPNRIYLNEFNILINSVSNNTLLILNKTKTVYLENDTVLKINVSSCLGECKVRQFYKKILLKEINFTDNSKFSYDVIRLKNSVTKFTTEYIGEFVIPLKNDTSKFFNNFGLLNKFEVWEKGNLVYEKYF
jgi:hypothetical protein